MKIALATGVTDTTMKTLVVYHEVYPALLERIFGDEKPPSHLAHSLFAVR
jgi:hypothetical protein